MSSKPRTARETPEQMAARIEAVAEFFQDSSPQMKANRTALKAGAAALRASLSREDREQALRTAAEYITVLEICQDGYYRADESDEAKAWHALKLDHPTPTEDR